MRARLSILLASAMALSASASAPTLPPKPPTAARTQKLKAPVDVAVELEAGSGRLRLTFRAAAEQVDIQVTGLDGLVVGSTTPLQRSSFRKGETATIDLSFLPGEGRSHLVVAVAGRFAGSRRSLTRTFALGKPSADQEKAAQEGVLTTSSGQRLRLLPVPPR